MRFVPLLLIGITVPVAMADGPVYKSVDESGHTTYSSTPPAKGVPSETVKIPPPPSPEQVRQAEEQQKKIEQLGTQLEQERKAREAAAVPPAADEAPPETMPASPIPAIRSRMTPGVPPSSTPTPTPQPSPSP